MYTCKDLKIDDFVLIDNAVEPVLVIDIDESADRYTYKDGFGNIEGDEDPGFITAIYRKVAA
ncbi:MAG: hypothetical protein DBP02_15270 [gamma proteobacterium symbiont of Ctena orbiculata]|nr:MAG: hypothetical protein DBP02_15270 [gamma proteobacterium symbiont of Ctena orbiculata]